MPSLVSVYTDVSDGLGAVGILGWWLLRSGWFLCYFLLVDSWLVVHAGCRLLVVGC